MRGIVRALFLGTLVCWVFVAIAPSTAFAVDWNRAISQSLTRIDRTTFGSCVGGTNAGNTCALTSDCLGGGTCSHNTPVYSVCPGLEIGTFTAAAAGQDLGTRVTVTVNG